MVIDIMMEKKCQNQISFDNFSFSYVDRLPYIDIWSEEKSIKFIFFDLQTYMDRYLLRIDIQGRTRHGSFTFLTNVDYSIWTFFFPSSKGSFFKNNRISNVTIAKDYDFRILSIFHIVLDRKEEDTKHI